MDWGAGEHLKEVHYHKFVKRRKVREAGAVFMLCCSGTVMTVLRMRWACLQYSGGGMMGFLFKARKPVNPFWQFARFSISGEESVFSALQDQDR
ncbi:hypothetical protein [Acetobacter okinawensis]|uniref:hypothetical protein n=1 Tax=Acetobacter okinawensis TaxID=1076594 RepID=UPI0011785CA5|nr:hypothetical protein [Acetobacter okinawensis]